MLLGEVKDAAIAGELSYAAAAAAAAQVTGKPSQVAKAVEAVWVYYLAQERAGANALEKARAIAQSPNPRHAAIARGVLISARKAAAE